VRLIKPKTQDHVLVLRGPPSGPRSIHPAKIAAANHSRSRTRTGTIIIIIIIRFGLRVGQKQTKTPRPDQSGYQVAPSHKLFRLDSELQTPAIRIQIGPKREEQRQSARFLLAKLISHVGGNVQTRKLHGPAKRGNTHRRRFRCDAMRCRCPSEQPSGRTTQQPNNPTTEQPNIRTTQLSTQKGTRRWNKRQRHHLWPEEISPGTHTGINMKIITLSSNHSIAVRVQVQHGSTERNRLVFY